MKKIVFSLLMFVSSLSCATTKTVPEKSVVQSEQLKVLETKTEPKSWASCDYQKNLNQGVCVFDLEKAGDEDDLGLAAQLMMSTFCDDKYSYTDIIPLPHKEKMYFGYFKCGHVGQPIQEDPSDQEESKSL